MRSLILLVPLALLAACSKESSAAGATKSPPNASSHTKDAVRVAVAEFKESTARTLEAIDRDLDMLREKAAAATDTAKEDIQKAVDELSEQRRKMADKLAELGDGASDAAKTALEDAKTILGNLKKGVADAVEKFK